MSNTRAESENNEEIIDTEETEGGEEGDDGTTLPPLRIELHQELESIHTQEETEDHSSVTGKGEIEKFDD